MRKQSWELCGARTRRGTTCLCKKLPGRTRCKYHGGMSTGPLTVEGKKKSAKNLEKALIVLTKKPPEWFQKRSQKAGATRRRRAKLRSLMSD